MMNLFLKSYTFCSILSYTGIYLCRSGTGSVLGIRIRIHNTAFKELRKRDLRDLVLREERLREGGAEGGAAGSGNKQDTYLLVTYLLTYLLVTVLLCILQVAWVKASYS